MPPTATSAGKGGVGTDTYHASKLHAVASINTGGGTLSFTYDANGNMTSRNGTTLTWFASNLPKAIVKDSANSSTFQYGPSGARWQQACQAGNVTSTQVYIGSLLEKVTEGANVDFRHTIFAEGQAVALYSRKSSGVNTLAYLLRDALGSVDVITDSAGAVTVRESFGAFGQRRGTAWSGAPSAGDLSTINGLTRRGYTGHEMLDSTDLIHMNGRVYDPLIARFASADPYLDTNLGTQGWNRFGYVGNNPLSSTDPSGFSTTNDRHHIRPIRPECAQHPSACSSWSIAWSGVDISHQTLTYIEAATGLASRYGDVYFGYQTGGLLLNWGGQGNRGSGTSGGRGEGSSGSGSGGADGHEAPKPPEAPPQGQPIGQCFNGSIGVGGAIQGPVLGPLGVGASGNILGGISYGGSWLDSRITVQGQISGFYGAGLYGGFGFVAQGGSGEVAQRFSGSVTPHAEANVGIGPVSASVSADFTSKGYQSVSGWAEYARVSRLGVGIGAAAGAGGSATGTYATPSIRQVGNALGALLGFRGNLLGSPAGCQ